MPETFFSANKKGSGGALFVSYENTDKRYFSLKVFPQNGPMEGNKGGSFDFKNGIFFKLSPDEVGELVRVVRTSDKHEFYHKFNDRVTTATFERFSFKKADKTIDGFGLSVKQGDKQIRVSLSLGGGERLRMFLESAYSVYTNAVVEKDTQEALNFVAKNEHAPTRATTVQRVNEVEQELVGDTSSDWVE